jgi:hypothetical protein
MYVSTTTDRPPCSTGLQSTVTTNTHSEPADSRNVNSLEVTYRLLCVTTHTSDNHLFTVHMIADSTSLLS